MLFVTRGCGADTRWVCLPGKAKHYYYVLIAMLCALSNLIQSMRPSFCIGGKRIFRKTKEALIQLFSNCRMFQNHLDGLLKLRFGTFAGKPKNLHL